MYLDKEQYPRERYIAPLIGAALIAGGSSILGGALSAASQSSANSTNRSIADSTNESNYKIAQMNNEYNAAQTDKILAWQRKQWEDTNRYNSAASQVQRLREAGLNPYLMANGGSAGTTTAMSGTSPARADSVQMQAAHVDPVINGQYLSEAGNNAVNAYLQYKEKFAQVKQIEIDNQTRLAENVNRLYNTYADTMNKKAQHEYQNIQNYIADATKQDAIEMVRNQRDSSQFEAQLKASQVTTQYLNNEMMKVQLAYLPQEKRAALANIGADTALKAAQAAKTTKEIDKIVEDTISTHLGNSITRAQKHALIDITVNTAKKIHNEAVHTGVPEGADDWFKFWNAASAALKPIGTALGGLR